jgi:hypothetical protein
MKQHGPPERGRQPHFLQCTRNNQEALQLDDARYHVAEQYLI